MDRMIRIVAASVGFAALAEGPLAVAQTPRSGNPILPGLVRRPRSARLRRRSTGSTRPTRRRTTSRRSWTRSRPRISSPGTKHPHVLDVADVKWAKRAVWAPSIVEKDGWYYLFFGANDIQNDQQVGGIGVARSRTPEGPFMDYLGKPLIDKFHNGAQPIDQMVFKDRDGTYYIVYGGWRHCNIAKLNDDFTGFVPLPDGTHVQGDHAHGVRRRRVHAAQGRQVLLHVVRGRLDGPELRRRVRGRLVAVRAVRARRQDPAAGFDRRDRRGASLRAAIAGDRRSGTSSTTAVRSARPTAITAS